MQQLDKGCGFDRETGEWVIWMTKPKDLSLPNKTLYYHGGECKLYNYRNKKGVDMFVLRGQMPPTVRDVKGYLIQMRKDLTSYVEKKKKAIQKDKS